MSVTQPRAGEQENRPVLFLTFTRPDPDEAPCIDVSGSLKESRRNAPDGFTYRSERQEDGTYLSVEMVEARGVCAKGARHGRR